MRLRQPVQIFRTNLVRGFWNKEMEIQNKGAVLVQIAPLFISQPRNQNTSKFTFASSLEINRFQGPR